MDSSNLGTPIDGVPLDRIIQTGYLCPSWDSEDRRFYNFCARTGLRGETSVFERTLTATVVVEPMVDSSITVVSLVRTQFDLNDYRSDSTICRRGPRWMVPSGRAQGR